MRRLLLCTVALVAATLTACQSQAPANTTASNKDANAASNAAKPAAVNHEADVKKFLSDLAAALNKNDAEAIGKFYADDYSIVVQTGEVQTRAQRIDSVKSGNAKFENVAFNDVLVKSYGDMAVSTSMVTGKSWMNGKEMPMNMRATSVLMKGKDGWKIVSSHTSEVTAAPKKDDAAKADDKKEDGKKDDAAKPEDKK